MNLDRNIPEISPPSLLREDDRRRGKQRLRLLLLGLVLVLALAGCSGQRLTSTSWPGILVDGEMAYVAFNQELFAVDPEAQRVEWQYPSEVDSKSPAFYAPPAVTDGLLVVGGYDKVLYGIDRENLAIKWSFHRATGRYIGSPVVSGDSVYVATAGNEVFSLDLAELERLGTVAKADEARRSAEAAAVRWEFSTRHGNWAAPLVTEDAVYVNSLDHHVYALNLETGAELWSTELPGAMAGTPLLSADGATIFVGTFDYNLYALDVATGEQRWQVAAENWIWSQPILAGEKLFFGDLSGYLYAVDPATGEVLWQEQRADAFRGAPIYDSSTNRLYVTGRKVANPGNISTRGVVIALDVDSYRTVWEQAVAEAVYTSPAIVGDKLVVAPVQGDALLHVFAAETGVMQWDYIPHPSEK